MGRRKYPFEEVKSYFEVNNCVLLENTYKNSNTLMSYICSCGNESNITFANFKNGHRCKDCGVKKMSSKISYSYEEVFNYFEEQGCKLLTNEYINVDTPMHCICVCGNEANLCLTSLRRGRYCKKCGRKRQADKRRIKEQEVRDYFQSQGCLLLEEEYINVETLMKYRCVCGNEAKIRFSDFKHGQRCINCKKEKLSGENHWNWNGGISEIDDFLRKQIVEWKKDSMRNGCYKCDITGDNNQNLEIHHLYSFHKILKETFDQLNLPILNKINEYTSEQLNLINDTFLIIHNKYGLGVLLDKSIHIEFHKIYSYDNFTPEDYYEFKEYKLKQLNVQSVS